MNPRTAPLHTGADNLISLLHKAGDELFLPDMNTIKNARYGWKYRKRGIKINII